MAKPVVQILFSNVQNIFTSRQTGPIFIFTTAMMNDNCDDENAILSCLINDHNQVRETAVSPSLVSESQYYSTAEDDEESCCVTSSSSSSSSSNNDSGDTDIEDLPEDPIEFVLLESKNMSDAACPTLTQSLIAKQMANLSMKDREAVYFDVHGVSGVVDEDAEPNFLDTKLQEMEQELDSIHSTMKQAYKQALDLNPCYVKNREFRLRFLRTDRFDAKAAAKRYVSHYARKLDLFGPDVLARDITQADMDKESLEALYCGYNQMLPRRDSTGRAVFLYVANVLQQGYSGRALARRFFYNAMMMSDDIETQRKGIVGLVYALDTFTEAGDYQLPYGSSGTCGGNGAHATGGSSSSTESCSRIGRIWQMGPCFQSVPLRMAGIHFCYNSITWKPVVSTLQMSADVFFRLRFRGHQGTHSECMFNLQTYGIPTETFPIDDNGQLLVDRYRGFLEKRQMQEKEWSRQQQDPQTQNDEGEELIQSTQQQQQPQQDQRIRNRITVPGSRDILLGRGKGSFNHVGNVWYRSIIEDLAEKYDKAEKGTKKDIVEHVIDMAQTSRGRFLKVDGAGWALVDDKAIRLKASHSFRATRAASNNNKNNAITTNNNCCPGTAPSANSKTKERIANKSKRRSSQESRNVNIKSPSSLACRDDNRNVLGGDDICGKRARVESKKAGGLCDAFVVIPT